MKLSLLLPAALVSALVAAPTRAQAPKPRPGDGLLQSLVDRAAETAPGTYAMAGATLERQSTGIPVVVQADILKGPDKTIRVPVAIGTDVPAAATVRLRIVSTGAGPRRVVSDATGSGDPGHVRLVHEFTLPAGEYEIQAVVGHRHPDGGTVAALAKSQLSVPDIWGGSLAMTPVVLGDAVLAGPGTTPRPFSFGHSTISPAVTDRFPQQGALNVAFRIYNWTPAPESKDAAAQADRTKPDLTVEYAFYQQTTKRLAFFNKVKSQRLAADTLDKDFDPAPGVVSGGMVVPLVSFPFGEFELKIRITDNRSQRRAERQVRFVVAP